VKQATNLVNLLEKASTLHDQGDLTERDRLLVAAQHVAGDLDRGIMRKRVQYAEPARQAETYRFIKAARLQLEDAYRFGSSPATRALGADLVAEHQDGEGA
jgi:hypothetical protein